MDSTVSPQLSGKMGALIGLIANVTRVVGEWTLRLSPQLSGVLIALITATCMLAETLSGILDFCI